jgi:hypothetical protein
LKENSAEMQLNESEKKFGDSKETGFGFEMKKRSKYSRSMVQR